MHEIHDTDTVMALKDTWHGLEILKEKIEPTIVDKDHRNVYFDIHEGTACADTDPVKREELLYTSKANNGLDHSLVQELLNTFTPCPENKILTREFEGIRYALGTPTTKYHSINNQKLMNAVCGSFDSEGIEYEIQTVGTLRGGKLFFASVLIKGEEERIINGDHFKFLLNIIQSHDGSYAMMMYDSNTRIVCTNTFRASLSDQGDVSIRIKKTANAGLRLHEAGATLANIYSGREVFVQMLRRFASVECDSIKAEQLFSAWKGIELDKETIISTRAFNQIVEVGFLHNNGIANNGETLYDLFNAVTEFYTNGNGTGHVDGTTKRTWTKFQSSEFGAGADAKAGFAKWLLKVIDDNELHAEAIKGESLLATKREVISAK